MAIKKRGEKDERTPDSSGAPARRSKGKKRRRPRPPGAKYLPDKSIDQYTLPASEGYETRSVPSDFATVSLTYSPKALRQTFRDLFAEFLKRARRGRPHTFRGPATGLDLKVTGVAIEQTSAESDEEASSYADLALNVFDEKIVYALYSFSDQLLLQVVVATLAELHKEGYVRLSETFHLKEMWREYLSAYEQAAKAHWAPMARGQRAGWPRLKLLKLAEAHRFNEAKARRLWDIYRSKKLRRWRDGGWKDEVRRELGDAYDWVLGNIPEKDEAGIALLLSSREFGLYEGEEKDGVAGIAKRLKEANEMVERTSRPDDYTPQYDEEAAESKFTILVDDLD
jgi:hypothetical protein